MSCVVVSVETNQIAMQNTEEELIANGKDTVDLAAGEWGVQEETDLDILFLVPDLLS